jgi:hypothetical protein
MTPDDTLGLARSDLRMRAWRLILSCDLLVCLGSQTCALETKLFLYHLHFYNYFLLSLFYFNNILCENVGLSQERHVCSFSRHTLKGRAT